MKIVVAIKQVGRLQDGFRLDEESQALPAKHLAYRMNEWDEYALEAAVKLTEGAGGEVVAVTVGPKQAEEVLFTALAKGAARALRIEADAALAGDPLEVARMLAAGIGPEKPDLVLCGVMAGDDQAGTVGTALAEALGLPVSTVVMSVAAKDGGLELTRELEGGAVQRVALPLPALLTIQTGTNEPRYASMRGIMQAKRKEIRTVTAASLGYAPRPAELLPRLRRLFVPVRNKQTAYLSGPPADVAAKLLDVLKEKGVIA